MAKVKTQKESKAAKAKAKNLNPAAQSMQEFKEFIKDQGLIGMAVGLILGTASGTLIRSLIDNIIMPPLGFILGSSDGLKGLSLSLGTTAAGEEAVLNYGLFLNDLVNFLVMAATVFIIIKVVSRVLGEDYAKKK